MKKFFSLFKDKKFLKRFFIVVIIILIIGSYIVYQKVADRTFIDDSLIQAPLITINPTTGGRVQEMDVTEGQKVQKGDQLAIVGSETIRAATDGLIVSAPNITGSTASVQTQIIQMINPVDIRVAGTLDENKGLNDIRVGQVVSFTVDAFPGKTYWGFVDEISPTAKTAQLSFSISSERPTQQFVVYARFDSAKYPEIKNGMSAKMTVYTKTN
jgi:membrane fusion protein (multidrug efflux system)